MAKQIESVSPQQIDRTRYEATFRFRQSLISGKSTGDEYVDAICMAVENPVVSAMIELNKIVATGLAPSFTHENDEISEFIKSQLSGQNSIGKIIGKLVLAKFVGFAIARARPCQLTSGLWGLGGIDAIHKKDFRFVRDSETKELKGIRLKGSEDVIPMDVVIHITSGDHLSFNNPYGVGAYPRIRSVAYAWELLVDDMVSSGRRHAIPFISATVEAGESELINPDTGTPALNDGQPIMVDNIWLASQEIGKLGDSQDAIVLANPSEVSSIDQASDGGFFVSTIRLIMQLAFIGMLTPESILTVNSSSAFGNGSSTTEHAKIIEKNVLPFVENCTEEIFEIIRLLIYWNFGEQDDYGSLTPKKPRDPDRMEMLRLLSEYAEDAFQDPRVNDKVKRLLQL